MKFSYEFYVALRYLKTKRKRRSISLNTFISMGGVTLGVAALIATLAVMTGFSEDLREKIVGTTSHIIVMDRTRDGLPNYQDLLTQVLEVPHVVSAAPFVNSQVLLTTEVGVSGVVIRGIDPDSEGTVTELPSYMREGTLDLLKDEPIDPETGNPERGIILGKELAGRLGAFFGEEITVISPSSVIGPFGMVPKMRRFHVVGIFDSGMYEYDSSLAYISLSSAQEFFDMGDTVTGLEIRVDDIFIADQVAGSIQNKLGFPYGARDWMQMNRNLFSALKLEKIMMFIILILIILVASFNIVSTLTMIVVEKSREIAILKAMGANRRGVMRIFMIDGLIIGLVGTVIGIPLGYGACQLLQTFITLPSDVYYISHIPVIIRASDVSLVSVSAILISFLATLYPSFQAANLEPAEALRYE